MDQVDVLVVGAGPAGTTVARKVARAGYSVLIADKRQELGAPIQCSGAVSRHALTDNEVEPCAEFIHEPIYGFRVMNGLGSETLLDYRQLKPESYGTGPATHPLGYVVDRRRFDRHLLTLAEREGARTLLKAEATGYTRANGLTEVVLKHYNDTRRVRCKIIVGADGLRSQVGKWAGINTHIKLKELASCLQYIVDGVETDGLLEIITGSQTAPGGYGWIFPKGGGYAEVGLGVIAPYTTQDARSHLEAFIRDSFLAGRFEKAKILEVQGGGVPLAAPLKKQYADNMILVGDAARQVNPITGGGIHTALSGGTVAAEFLNKHLRSGNSHSAANLAGYQKAWLVAFGRKMWKLYGVKSDIFRQNDGEQQDRLLFNTMSGYFSPDSEFKKV